MGTPYCSAETCGPLAPVDWVAKQAAVNAITDPDARAAAQAQLDAERVGCPSHYVANGNGPRTLELDSAQVVDLVAWGQALVVIGDDRDAWGGGQASLVSSDGTLVGALRCPDCLALARSTD